MDVDKRTRRASKGSGCAPGTGLGRRPLLARRVNVGLGSLLLLAKHFRNHIDDCRTHHSSSKEQVNQRVLDRGIENRHLHERLHGYPLWSKVFLVVKKSGMQNRRITLNSWWFSTIVKTI
jgi:hypothetical protein